MELYGKVLLRLIISLLISCNFQFTPAQNVFQRSGNGHHTQSSAGGGFFSVAGNSLFEVSLGKMDSYGNAQWAKTYDFGGSNIFTYSMAATKDSGAVIAGTTYNGVSFYPFLIKADKTGSTDFIKLYGTGGFYDVKQTCNGGYIACGYNTGNSMIIRTDENGNILWANTYGSSILYSVSQCMDSSFVASGLINDNIYLLKISKTGTVQWAKELGFTGQDNGQCVIEDSDGGIIVSGQAGFITSPYQQSKGCILKTDKNGNLLWCKLLKDLNVNTNQQIGTANYVAIGKDNSLILLNYTMVNFQGTNNLIKINPSLNISWAKDYAGGVSSNINFSGSVFSLPDNTYLLSKWNGYSFKIDSTGNAGCRQKTAHFELISSIPSVNNLAISPVSFNSATSITANITASSPSFPNSLITIDSLRIAPEGATSFCSGGYVILKALSKTSNASTATYLWNNTDNQSQIMADSTSKYKLVATSLSYCTRDTSIDITELPLPPAGITVSGATTFCDGDSVKLSAAEGNYSYLWWPGGIKTSRTITVLKNGSYAVSVTNKETGCNSTSSSGEIVTVTVKPSPSSEITRSGPTGFCTGDSVMLTAAEASFYLWSNGKTTKSISAKTSGNYYVTLTGSNGCISQSESVEVSAASSTQPLITIQSDNDSACSGTGMRFTATTMYEGSSPAYEWRINRVSQGSGFNTAEFILSDGDSVDCVLTSNLGCVTLNKDTSNAIKIKVITAPETPGAITGDNTLCSGTTKSYTINPVSGANYYEWEVPDGTSVSSGQGTSSIQVKFGITSGQIRVTSKNMCGSGFAQFKNITVNTPPSPISGITGNDTLCANSIIKFYSANFIPNADSYNWTLPPGATVRSGEGSSTIVLDFGTQSGNLSVSAVNSCGTNETFTKPIVIIPVPEIEGDIAGPATVCQNMQGITYSINPVSGDPSYLWELTGGGSIASKIDSSAITVNLLSTGTTFKVTASNVCGTSAAKTKNVNVKLIPEMPQNIAGPLSICENASGITYTAETIDGATSYNWSVTGDAAISDGQGTNSIVIRAGDSNSDVSVNTANICGSSMDKSFFVTINPLPESTSEITGQAQLCPESKNVLYSAGFSNAESYQWNVPDNCIITGGGTEFITVDFGNTGGDITVQASNSCGLSNIITKGITVNPLPEKPVIDVNDRLLTSPDAATYQWFMDGQILNGENDKSFTATTTGNYQVLTANDFGCTNISDSVFVEMQIINSLDDLSGALKTYPNPFTDQVIIEIPDLQVPQSIALFDIMGNKVFEVHGSDVISNDKLVLNTANIHPGTYLLMIRINDRLFSRKIYKQH